MDIGLEGRSLNQFKDINLEFVQSVWVKLQSFLKIEVNLSTIRTGYLLNTLYRVTWTQSTRHLCIPMIYIKMELSYTPMPSRWSLQVLRLSYLSRNATFLAHLFSLIWFPYLNQLDRKGNERPLTKIPISFLSKLTDSIIISVYEAIILFGFGYLWKVSHIFLLKNTFQYYPHTSFGVISRLRQQCTKITVDQVYNDGAFTLLVSN
jgi:hypothetical protein